MILVNTARQVMTVHCRNCIVSPLLLQRLLQNQDREVRESALATLLATTRFRSERSIVAGLGAIGLY